MRAHSLILSDGISSWRFPTITWIMRCCSQMNGFPNYDVFDMVWFRVCTERRISEHCKSEIIPPLIEPIHLNKKITEIMVDKHTNVKRFWPIQTASLALKQKFMEQIGIQIIKLDASNPGVRVYESCIGFMYRTGIMPLPMYCYLTTHEICGIAYIKNEVQINPVLKFFELGTPLDPNNIPEIEYYLMVGIADMATGIRKFGPGTYQLVEITKKRHAASCVEMALISVIEPYFPGELYPLILYYMTMMGHVLSTTSVIKLAGKYIKLAVPKAKLYTSEYD